MRALGSPIKFSATPGDTGAAAPLLGQHTREVLREFDYGEAEIESLLRAGAVAAA